MDGKGNFYLDSVKGKYNAEVFHATACIYSLLEKTLSDYLRPFQLSSVKFNALMLIKHQGKEKGISQHEISHHLIVSPSNITRLLDRLIEDKYVTRVPSEEDRRVNLIKITKKGSDILDQLWQGYVDIMCETVTTLEEEEVKQLSKLLLKWFSKLEAR